MKQIAFLTMADQKNYVIDDNVVILPLMQLGYSTKNLPWDDAFEHVGDFSAFVIRSTFDYVERLDLFLQMLDRVEGAGGRVINRKKIVNWNCNKTYMADLWDCGIEVVPSLVYSCDGGVRSLGWIAPSSPYDEVVLKPLVGASGIGVEKLSFSKCDEYLPAFRRQWGGFLMQAFLPSIVDEGEYSLIFFAGNYSHCILKRPQAGSFLVQEEHGGVAVRVDEPRGGASLGAAILKVAANLLNIKVEEICYARVDVARLPSNELALMELELIEPQLFLRMAPEESSQLFARAIHSLIVAD